MANPEFLNEHRWCLDHGPRITFMSINAVDCTNALHLTIQGILTDPATTFIGSVTSEKGIPDVIIRNPPSSIL
jgi:hypothetical protein